MKDLRLLFMAILIVLATTACSVTTVTPTPTVAIIPLPAGQAGASAASSPARQQSQAAATATATPAPLASPTPTRVLSAVLPAQSTPTPSATRVAAAAPAPAPQPVASGRLVLQVASGGSIRTINADGSGGSRVASGLDPAWSPDGKQVAFTSWDNPQGVYVVNADGSNLHMVYEVSHAKSPTWSPDGTKIAFTWVYKTETRGGRPGGPAPLPDEFWRVSMIDLVSGNKTDMPLDPDIRAWAPDWGPDGRIVYKGMRGIFVSDLTNTPVQITKDPLDTTPVWSPDGKQIAMAVRKQDHWDIAVCQADGTGFRQITLSSTDIHTRPVNNVAPRWTPDGKSIAFVSDRSGTWRIYVMNPDGTNQHLLLDTAISYDFADERVFSWTK